MEFGIFQATFPHEGKVVISFSALMNPAKPESIIKLSAESVEAATLMARDLLNTLGIETHRIHGDPVMVMSNFPYYYVGQLDVRNADMYDTPSLVYHIETFHPVPKKWTPPLRLLFEGRI